MNETVVAFLKVSHNLVRTGMHLFLQVKCSSVSLFLRKLFRSSIVENACSHSYCEEAPLPVFTLRYKVASREENIYFSYCLYSFLFVRLGIMSHGLDRTFQRAASGPQAIVCSSLG